MGCYRGFTRENAAASRTILTRVATLVEKPAAKNSSATTSPSSNYRWLRRARQRARDCLSYLIAGLALLVLWPLMLFIALAIKFDSTGPVLFRQVRYGRRRRPFVLLKYRTLYVDQCDAPRAPIKQVTPGDPRVTPLGRLLRRTSLDELPQLLNVLRGDMAIVGPRPHPLALDDYFSPRIPRYNLRHAVKPGLTGLAQVNGCRGETASLEAMRNRVQYDLEYVRSCTCLVDLKVALLTCALMARKNAY